MDYDSWTMIHGLRPCLINNFTFNKSEILFCFISIVPGLEDAEGSLSVWISVLKNFPSSSSSSESEEIEIALKSRFDI